MPDTRMTLLSASALMATELVLPVMRGVVGIYMPTDDAAAAIKNWKNGGGDGAIVGSPTYGTGYFTSSTSSNRITTGFAETVASTQYVVARSGAAFDGSTTRPIVCGIFRAQDSGFAGTSIRVTATPSAAPAATLALGAARDATGVPTLTAASLDVADFREWTLLCGRVKDGAVSAARLLNDLTNDTAASADASTARTLANTTAGTNIMTMGNSSSLSYGTVDQAYYVLATVVHTDAEMAANAVFIRDAVDFLYGFTV